QMLAHLALDGATLHFVVGGGEGAGIAANPQFGEALARRGEEGVHRCQRAAALPPSSSASSSSGSNAASVMRLRRRSTRSSAPPPPSSISAGPNQSSTVVARSGGR